MSILHQVPVSPVPQIIQFTCVLCDQVFKEYIYDWWNVRCMVTSV